MVVYENEKRKFYTEKRRWNGEHKHAELGEFVVIGVDRKGIATIRFDSGIEVDFSYKRVMNESRPVDKPSKIFKWEIDKPIEEALFEALGAVSVCWDHPELAGDFDSDRAKAIGDELMDLLRRKLWTE